MLLLTCLLVSRINKLELSMMFGMRLGLLFRDLRAGLVHESYDGGQFQVKVPRK